MPRIDLDSITPWITRAAVTHGTELRDEMARRLAIGPRRAASLLRELVDRGWLVEQGTGRRRSHRPGAQRQVVQTYPLAGLEEDLPWRRDFRPFFELRPSVASLLGQAFTELLNNAIEHSGGTQVSVSLRQTPHQLQLLVADDGVGLFHHLRETVDIEDPVLALLELSKGRLTSQPLHHCGHGLFLSARLADVFHMQANGEGWLRRQGDMRGWQKQRLGQGRPGTTVYLSIACDTPRTLETVLEEWRADTSAADFSRTAVPLRLLTAADSHATLHSRADARRVTHRLAAFALAELDFEGIEAIGPAFADELLRVWGSSHPEVCLKLVRAAPEVMQALQRVSSTLPVAPAAGTPAQPGLPPV